MKALEVELAVVVELARRGVEATLEYPGFLQVGLQQYGTTGETWSGDVYESEEDFLEGHPPIENLVSDIPSDSKDVEAISTWIACNQPLEKPQRLVRCGGYRIDPQLYDVMDDGLVKALTVEGPSHIPPGSNCGMDCVTAINGFNRIAWAYRQAHGNDDDEMVLSDLAGEVVRILNIFIFG